MHNIYRHKVFAERASAVSPAHIAEEVNSTVMSY